MNLEVVCCYTYNWANDVTCYEILIMTVLRKGLKQVDSVEITTICQSIDLYLHVLACFGVRQWSKVNQNLNSKPSKEIYTKLTPASKYPCSYYMPQGAPVQPINTKDLDYFPKSSSGTRVPRYNL